MAKVLVSLVSDQTIQNVQFVREFTDIDSYLFVSTQKMEQKFEWIKNTLSISDELIEKIVVSEFDAEHIRNELYKVLQLQNEYIVNITGGTKIMSLTAYEVFKTIPNAKIYYITGSKNEYLQLHPENQRLQLKHQLGLLEYITSYGILLRNEKQNIHTLLRSVEQTQKLYDVFVSNIDKKTITALRDILQSNSLPEQFRYNANGKQIDILKVEGLADFLKEIGYKEEFITTEFGSYLTGLWLEEYTLNKIRNALQITDNQIGKGLKLQKKGVMNKGDNDFDVMFIWKNELYIIECKTSHFIFDKQTNKPKSELTTYIYKLDALRKEFGIFPKAFIYTLGDLGSNPDELKRIEERLKFHNITLLTHQEKLLESNQQNFSQFLQSLLS